MRIDPDMRALRDDAVSQRRARECLEGARDAWRARPDVAPVLAGFDAYAAGADLAACPALERWAASPGAALPALQALVVIMAAGLRDYPLGHVPFRHQGAEGLAVLQLAQAGGSALSLLCYEAGAAPADPPPTLCFADSERHEMILAGEAEVAVLTLREQAGGALRIESERRRLAAGDALHLSGPDTAKRIAHLPGRLVILRLARAPAHPQPSREIRLADGALVHRASGDRGESHREMMMAVLGRMGRRDAAPLLAELAREGSPHARWQALRECLALDTAVGFAALGAMARASADPLQAQAEALRRQLLAVHPQLAELELASCPA